MSAKCPTCGQAMPKVEGWKVDARDLGPSHYVDGALAWFGDGEEGGSLEQSSLGMNAAEELAKQARMYIEDRSVENKAEVDFFAIEAAAHELAPTLAAEQVPEGRPIPWKKGAKTAIVHRASILAAEAVKAAQEKP